MHPFVLGQEYPRGHLLNFLGSKQGQSGVLWGSREPGCLICTSGGRHGKKAGYSDEALQDGSWWYLGQGQTGDQNLRKAANARLASSNKSVLFFTTREPTSREIAAQGGYGKLFAFRGSFNVSGFEFFTPQEGPRQSDRLLRFRLMPANDNGVAWFDGGESALEVVDLTAVQRELNIQAQDVAAATLSVREYRKRSAQVHQYALLRAAGSCEACRLRAPFVAENGNAFLEVHHLLRLADDGLDAPANVAALCPNCHRRAHHSVDRGEFGRKLCEFVIEAERRISG